MSCSRPTRRSSRRCPRAPRRAPPRTPSSSARPVAWLPPQLRRLELWVAAPDPQSPATPGRASPPRHPQATCGCRGWPRSRCSCTPCAASRRWRGSCIRAFPLPLKRFPRGAASTQPAARALTAAPTHRAAPCQGVASEARKPIEVMGVLFGYPGPAASPPRGTFDARPRLSALRAQSGRRAHAAARSRSRTPTRTRSGRTIVWRCVVGRRHQR